MNLSPKALWRCARLNARVARHALAWRWLEAETVAEGYDRVALYYDEAWQRHLRPVTDHLLDRIPTFPDGRVLDLGCGTGYTTDALGRRHPNAAIVAVDLSDGMLAQARPRVERTGVEFVRADMLEYLSGQKDQSTALILSAWAIGYSQPARLLEEAARVLKPGGILAFVVNLQDTLAPVFRAYRLCLARFPDQVRLAARLHFPKDWPAVKRMLLRSGLVIEWHQDGLQPITPPAPATGSRLSWLLKTGVLAGFDAMLPLAGPGRVSEHFERLLRSDPAPLQHHYAAAVARRP